MDPTDVIFHEKQEGSLCAQHCLNALLQGAYFTAVDLATIAQNLDDEEQERMAEGGLYSEAYKKFLEQPSTNMDDSGYFSVQVIVSALKVWSLEVIPFQSQNPVAVTARANPTSQVAFICNYKDHWFAIRRIGRQWFNLNSLLTYPELISATYLTMFIAQLEQEGYSIFVVIGKLPECEADNLLKHVLAVQNVRPKLLSEVNKERKETKVECKERMSEEEKEFQEAVRLSLIDAKTEDSSSAASQIDLLCREGPGGEVSLNEMRLEESPSMTEEEMLETALKMSMEGS